MKKTGADIFRRTIELLLLLAIAVSAFFLAAPFVAFSNEGRESSVPAERQKNILIVGKSDRKTYLVQVLLGAEKD